MMLHHRGNFVLAPREFGYIIAGISQLLCFCNTVDYKISKHHGKQSAEHAAGDVEHGDEGVVATQERDVLVAERGERGEATAQAGGKQQRCGVVAKVSACGESVEQADEQTAGDVYGKRVIGERSRHVVLHKL